LLAGGADTLIQNDEQRTALDISMRIISSHDFELASEIATAVLEVDLMTALTMLSDSGESDLVNCVDNNGCTRLHLAAQSGDIEMVGQLV